MSEQGPSIKRLELLDIEVLEQKASEAQSAAKGIIDQLGSFGAFSGVMGHFLLGSEQKTVKNADGTTKKAAWTMEDFIDAMAKMQKEQEAGVREGMLEELQFAMGSQWMHFRNSKSPLVADSNNVIAFVVTLAQRMSESKEDISDSYPVPWLVTESRWEAELLEIIRRTVLRPSYILVEGVGENDIRSIPSYSEEAFWEEVSEKHRRIKEQLKGKPYRNKEFYQLQKQQTSDIVEARTPEEWESIVILEKKYIGEYVAECSKRAVKKASLSIDFADSIAKSGERIYSDEEIANLRQELGIYKQTATEAGGIGDLNILLSWIKEKFGEKADYQTFLQLLNPVELKEDTETFRKNNFIR